MAASGPSGTNDVWPLISNWVEMRRKEGTTASDVMDALGLHLHAADEDEEARWALVAMAAVQYRQRALPRKRLRVADAGVDRALALLRSCSRIVVVSGPAVSAAVPGFQSYWDSLAEGARGGLTEAADLFDMGSFASSPEPYLGYARSLLFGGHAPSSSHLFVRELERRAKLQRNYTQNVDALEVAAGIERAVYCHGSVAVARCIACRTSVPCDDLQPELTAASHVPPPRCAKCAHPLNLLKPDAAFAGEARDETPELRLREDLAAADLLLVLGSALEAEPLRSIPLALPPDVPQVRAVHVHGCMGAWVHGCMGAWMHGCMAWMDVCMHD